jgi:hypothetical protein
MGLMEAKLPDSSGWLWNAAECVRWLLDRSVPLPMTEKMRRELQGASEILVRRGKCSGVTVS